MRNYLGCHLSKNVFLSPSLKNIFTVHSLLGWLFFSAPKFCFIASVLHFFSDVKADICTMFSFLWLLSGFSLIFGFQEFNWF